MFLKFLICSFIYAICIATMFTTEINLEKAWLYFGILTAFYVALFLYYLLQNIRKRKIGKENLKSDDKRSTDILTVPKLARDRGSLSSNPSRNASLKLYSEEENIELREQVKSILQASLVLLPMPIAPEKTKTEVLLERKNTLSNSRRPSAIGDIKEEVEIDAK
eukprot:NODE_390_length_9461_cov_0.447768.p4 type:complete len:164 gc:universal NODE_390_length_9461_cov_0.447768:8873-9364(+)